MCFKSNVINTIKVYREVRHEKHPLCLTIRRFWVTLWNNFKEVVGETQPQCVEE
jgi:hypothetical protein